MARGSAAAAEPLYAKETQLLLHAVVTSGEGATREAKWTYGLGNYEHVSISYMLTLPGIAPLLSADEETIYILSPTLARLGLAGVHAVNAADGTRKWLFPDGERDGQNVRKQFRDQCWSTPARPSRASVGLRM